VQQAVETTRPLIDQNKHELTVSLPPEPIWLHADALRLEEVIVNLLNNAAKYTPEGGHIWLSIQQEGNQMVLRVRDSGIGIAPDSLPHIFELFTQAPRSLDRSQGGLGIGLAVVRKLVEMHGGTVEAQSAGLGKGSEFVVRLPVLSSPTGLSQPLSKERDEHSGTGWRVLVVDDNVDSADSIAMLLQVSGHEVRVAYSGQEALETAAEYQPDIVLLDIGLPGMDGYEVARRLRAHAQLEKVKLIAVTGYGQDADRLQSQEAGFDYHLVKPVDAQKLQDVLVELMAQK
jgi:CheY-like chemotaxis protein